MTVRVKYFTCNECFIKYAFFLMQSISQIQSKIMKHSLHGICLNRNMYINDVLGVAKFFQTLKHYFQMKKEGIKGILKNKTIIFI